MAARMNTFAVVLLAFPFYLAVKGRLAAYVNLAKPASGSTTTAPAATSANAATAQGLSAQPSANSSDTPTAHPVAVSNGLNVSDLTSMAGSLTDAMELFT
jgi:hypothetical protein